MRVVMVVGVMEGVPTVKVAASAVEWEGSAAEAAAKAAEAMGVVPTTVPTPHCRPYCRKRSPRATLGGQCLWL